MELFFDSLVRGLVNFRTRWCVEPEGVGKLRPKASTSVSMGDSWWEERFHFRFCLVFLKFLVVRFCGKSFLNEGMEYGRLGCAILANFSELSLRFLLMYAWRKRRRYLAKKQVVTVYLVEAIAVRVVLFSFY